MAPPWPVCGLYSPSVPSGDAQAPSFIQMSQSLRGDHGTRRSYMPSERPRHSGTASEARREPAVALRLTQVCLLALLFLLPTAARAQDLDLASLKRQSQLVFVGTIEKIGAATEANIPVDDRTAIVRVDRVLRSTDQFRALNGREVTVQLRQEQPAAKGDTALLFSRRRLYGHRLAVVE